MRARGQADIDFSADERRLVVANREGRSLTCYAREPGGALRFAQRPAWSIRGRSSGLAYCDGAKFVPASGAFVAAVNLRRSTVTFYGRGLLLRSRYRGRRTYVPSGPASGLTRPDGLAFSDDGRLLAVTNHGGGSVTVYARGGRAAQYGPAPLVELGASRLRYPHSLAFSPGGTHLAVTDAGGRCVCVYRCPAGAEPEEGGSQGVAFGADRFAVCSPEFGLRVHRTGRTPARESRGREPRAAEPAEGAGPRHGARSTPARAL